MDHRTRRIRVLVCAPNLSRGGAERMSLQLIEALDQSRFDVTMYVQERHEPQYHPSPFAAQRILYGFHGPYKRWQLIPHFFRMLGLSRNHDVLVGASEGRASLLSILAGVMNRKPVILWIHADWNLFSRSLSWRTRLSMSLYRKARGIVAPSEGVAHAHAKNFPESAGLLQVVPNGINVNEIERACGERLPDALEALFNKKTVVAVGRLDEQKGFDLLIRAHAMTARRGIESNLIIIGVGGERQNLETLAGELNVTDSVHFIGFQDNPHKFMARATVFVLSSRFEGFGLVVAEALACGAPVISFDCPSGPSEILEEGESGILVPPQDVEGLAREIADLLSRPERRTALSAKGRARARAYDIDAFGRAWAHILASAAGCTDDLPN